MTSAVDQAVLQIETAIKSIQQESAAWRNELPQLQDKLNSLVEQQQAQATADVRQVLADTSNNVGALAQDTIQLAGLTGEQLIARFGTEARCNIDFARTRVTATLQNLIERLKFWQASDPRALPVPPPHSVCQITPDTVELRSTGSAGGWAMTQPTDKIVGVFGYDFRPDALPVVEFADLNGAKVRDAVVQVTYVTRYQINLNFVGDDFAQAGPGSRYVLRWPDRPEPNAVSVSLVQPARLRILGVNLQTSSARARADIVRPAVDLINEGGVNTGPFVVRWRPGPNDGIQSLSVNDLGPGERRTLTFPGYAYQNAGRMQTDIVVGDGSDSWHGMLDVTPYANSPREQSIPIRGEWPDGGGDRGDLYSNFRLSDVTLGQDCVLDTTRGGGSFEVSDIDDDNRKYRIAWPSGYNFDFDGNNTFWRSISAVSANYDAQARRLSPIVTLKGLGGHGGIFAKRGPERFAGTFTAYVMCPQ